MTFDELASEYAADTGISLKKAKEELNPGIQLFSSKVDNTYRTISCSLHVSSSYKPTLRYYCQTTESGSFHGIKKILSINMNRQYKGKSYTFVGNVYSHLRDPNKIFFIVNGDFYKEGSGTINGGLNLSVGQKATVSFGASYTLDHYKYFYVEDTLRW